MISTLLTICNKIWQTGEWPTPWTQSLIITSPRKVTYSYARTTISLISHTSKVTLNILLKRLKPQAEKIIAEEQAGFRPGRSTPAQIFNLRILCERYLDTSKTSTTSSWTSRRRSTGYGMQHYGPPRGSTTSMPT